VSRVGFFDEFQEISGNWVGKEEKAAMVADETPFNIVSVQRITSRYGPRYVVKTRLDDEDRLLGFGAESVESRDRFFDAVITYLEQHPDEEIEVKMRKSGQSILVVNAEA